MTSALAEVLEREQSAVRVGYRRGEPAETLLTREWLVTNGLGGYASGSLGGVMTRRFHGYLVAALPPPLGRTMMLNELIEEIDIPGEPPVRLGGREIIGQDPELSTGLLEEFRLELGLPVWQFRDRHVALEKRVVMPYRENTALVLYRLEHAPRAVRLVLRPAFQVRPHEGRLEAELAGLPYAVRETEHGFEVHPGDPYPVLRLGLTGARGFRFVVDPRASALHYRIERARGYDSIGIVWSPGVFEVDLDRGESAALAISTEQWAAVRRDPEHVIGLERERRKRLLETGHELTRHGLGAELALAADQFIIRPRRREEELELQAAGSEPCTVIAGYHWFTDWGRDTMISLEGLTLLTGRHDEARHILETFASHVEDGLIPNLFPEGKNSGLYHTADATLWFFHALYRYETITGDCETRRKLMPKLVEILAAHERGTRFGIHVDRHDGLLCQGADGYQLTWMDAKVDDWVVTPRRGKAVEINALYYNALRIAECWLNEQGSPLAAEIAGRAARLWHSFNERFWYERGGYLYDVIDCPGNADGSSDSALRPNQLLAIALPFPVLEERRWKLVVDEVHDVLLTPVGLRTLDPAHPDYKACYDGDLRARDAAYHEGTVWVWLFGPFLAAWLKVHPEDYDGARRLIEGFAAHLGEACIGSISEIFDAEAPYHPRGCVAQAWSVAEALRALAMTAR